MITINRVFGQYPALMLDFGSQAGYAVAHIEKVGYWVPNASGKAINNDGGVNYIFENNHSIFTDKGDISSLFSGTAVTECTATGCGTNKFKWIGLPSF